MSRRYSVSSSLGELVKGGMEEKNGMFWGDGAL